MLTTCQGFLAWTLIHADETEGDEENSPDDTTQEDPSAVETQESSVDSEGDEVDGSDSTVMPSENQRGDEETAEADWQPAAEVKTDEESHSNIVEGAVVAGVAEPASESTEGVTTSPDDVAVLPLIVEQVEETASVDEVAAETTEAEAAEVIPTDTADEAVEDAKAPLSFGVIDEVYNFVNEFQHSQLSHAEQTSANAQDSVGGVKKAALFEHPPAEGYARVQYEVTLPQVESNENLILHFSIGLRDGVDFELSHAKPDGVQFAIEVSDERCFEGVSEVCQWAEHLIDLSDFAGSTVKVAFLTSCNGAGNTDCDWALWGNPRVLKLARTSLLLEKGEDEPRLRRGLALGLLDGEPPELSVAEFDLEVSTLASEIADVLSQQMGAKAEASVAELALYTEQPSLEIVTAGPSVALVAAREDFDLQCTVRNNGPVPLEPIHEATVSINRIKLRRGRTTQPLRRLNPDEETTFSWSIRSFFT